MPGAQGLVDRDLRIGLSKRERQVAQAGRPQSDHPPARDSHDVQSRHPELDRAAELVNRLFDDCCAPADQFLLSRCLNQSKRRHRRVGVANPPGPARLDHRG